MEHLKEKLTHIRQLIPDASILPARRLASVVASSVDSLPPELLEKSVLRLGWMAVGFTIVWAFYIVFAPFADLTVPALFFWTGIPSTLLGVVLSFLVIFRVLRNEWLLLLGLGFEVVTSFLLALSESWGRFDGRSMTWVGMQLVQAAQSLGLLTWDPFFAAGISWICLWIVLFALLVPSTPRQTFIVAHLTALSVPFAIILSFMVHGVAAPLRGHLLSFLILHCFPVFLAADVAWISSLFIHRLSHAISEAREMGSYRLVERLGQGGMGEVWRAEHRLLARPAAVKLIRPEALGSEGSDPQTALRRFEREAQATASLASPHAVQLYDYGVAADGTFYYVMELLNGLDLSTLVQRYGPLPEERVAHLLRQACHALAEAHDKGLIHRDIKPANLFLCRYGIDDDFVKVLDFGLVKPMMQPSDEGPEQLTRAGVLAGTPAYLAPEALTGDHPIDGRMDLYSLGCVGYWLLTGRPVFQGANAVKLILSHAKELPAPPSQVLGAPILPELERLILACLEKNPADRPQTPGELRAALDQCVFPRPWTFGRAKEWWQTHPDASRAPLDQSDSSSHHPARSLTVSLPGHRLSREV